MHSRSRSDAACEPSSDADRSSRDPRPPPNGPALPRRRSGLPTLLGPGGPAPSALPFLSRAAGDRAERVGRHLSTWSTAGKPGHNSNAEAKCCDTLGGRRAAVPAGLRSGRRKEATTEGRVDHPLGENDAPSRPRCSSREIPTGELGSAREARDEEPATEPRQPSTKFQSRDAPPESRRKGRVASVPKAPSRLENRRVALARRERDSRGPDAARLLGTTERERRRGRVAAPLAPREADVGSHRFWSLPIDPGSVPRNP
ncbi:hypothetical protein KM043_012333 [Ampulex compressa]|nr:hypothetical protein KM043_012333 [Ampulex compressa]